MSPPARAAVVIPAFRHPSLLGEAVESALQQTEPCVIVVVIDGCPMAETYETAACFARAFPDRVHVIRRPNGGVSAARNTGIEFVLRAWPEVEAVMFLDADNRIAPRFIARALNALDVASGEVGWVYPDIDMIGVDESSATGGEFSRLALLDWNYCDVGSVVRRRLLEHGLRFDESIRLGFEDWDFWLEAAAAGFVGQHLPNAGFGYRRRGESRFLEASRRGETVLAAMIAKRGDYLRPRRLFELEAVEAPRFALIFAGGGAVRFTSDPLEPRLELPLVEAAARLREAQASPGAARFPAYSCFASEAALAALADVGIVASVFWLAQVRLRRAARMRVFLRSAEGPEARFTEAVGEAHDEEAAAIFAVSAGAAAGPTADLIIEIPGKGPPAAAAARAVLEFSQVLAASPRLRVGWRPDVRPARNDILALYGRVCGIGAVLPALRPSDSRGEIGFVIPIHTFGGVEKVVASQARVLRRLGFRPHLFVTRGASFVATPATREAFVSVNLLIDPNFDRAAPGTGYFGAHMSSDGDRSDGLGLLSMMDAVIHTHSLGAHALAGRLRSFGIVTLTALHLVDRDAFGAFMGNPQVALAYEHAYDGFLVISQHLRRWCLAHGVPEAKIVVVPNSPSYPARGRASRGPRAGRLRALFLGRLDAQKGIDRLAAIIGATRAMVDWRVIGQPVLDAAGDVPDPGVAVEAPLHDPDALDAAYDWADVLVLPSRFEGVPLTLLEARRRGVVVLASDVGAVQEAVGAGGCLVADGGDEAALIGNFVRRLEEWSADPALFEERARAVLADPPLEAEQAIAPLAAWMEARLVRGA